MRDTIVITGNLGTDPELKRTAGGIPIASFRVGSGQRKFDKATQSWVDDGTSWFAVSAFRSLAEHAHASLRRGDRVVLTGRLRVRNWDNGTSRGTAVEIDAESIGHDLLWGTTVFTKSARASAPASDEGWEAPEAPHDAWAAPGVSEADVEDQPDQPQPQPQSQPQPLALVGSEPPF